MQSYTEPCKRLHIFCKARNLQTDPEGTLSHSVTSIVMHRSYPMSHPDLMRLRSTRASWGSAGRTWMISKPDFRRSGCAPVMVIEPSWIKESSEPEGQRIFGLAEEYI